MCGIAGYSIKENSLPGTERRLEKASSLLSHRGPDGSGIYFDNRIGLAHRRLAIIDIVRGSQPLTDAAGEITVVFNGEIYNFSELKHDLEKRGCVFTTRSDTEVLANIIRIYGKAGIEKLKGMFAFCALNHNSKRMLVVRDRLGVKPLFYVENSSGFFFASEIPALLTLSGCDRKIDPEALDLYLSLRYVPHPFCAFEEIRRLPPGHLLEVEKGKIINNAPFWSMNPTKRNMDYRQACIETKERFDQAVVRRLVSDVPLGAFLSGGIDSSLTVASMALRGPVKTFSIGFEDERFNELPYARQIADHLKTDHHEFYLPADSLLKAPEILALFGEPFSNETAIPLYFLSKFASGEVKVALTGDGGDEAFGGYKRYGHCLFIKRLERLFLRRPYCRLRKTSTWAESILNRSRKKKSFPARSADRALLLNQPMRYLAFLELFPLNSRKLLFHPSGPLVGKIVHPTAVDLIGSFYNQIRDDELDRLQLTDINTYLPGDILFYSDHMSMAHGLELRSPFLDHDVLEFALSLPSEYRMTTSRKGKRILRDAFSDRISKAMFERPKKGFSIPLARWIGGPLKNKVQEVIMNAPDDFYRLFEKQGVSNLLSSEIGKDGLKARQLWSLFILAKWMVRFKAVLP
ncbi:MAG: asparagine synthase (glutamine-hydrolyzing) [Deltaproteobacteria bacterium]|nr:asparagine synthase (glutamine-hydrolyzing) [Deltaproteobacteria bacterium]